jgi:general secretion pathway protein A
MYHQHFGLTGDAFSLTPDPDCFYPSPQHREAMAALEYGLMERRGFITLVGEVGTGKTTVLYSVLSRLGFTAPGEPMASLAAAYVPYAPHCFDDLLAAALRDLGENPAPDASRRALIQGFEAMLLKRDATGQRTALVIDEAQGLSDETFEQLRLLSNFETYTHKLVQIVLVGQPELQDRLHERQLRQLRERVSVRAVINPLDARSMHAYIAHRLVRAGGDLTLFHPAALRAIVRHARGIPRRANSLCHNAMLFAFGRGAEQVSARAAREAIAEMEERQDGWWRRPALRRLPTDRAIWRRWARRLGVPVAASIALLLAATPSSRTPTVDAPSPLPGMPRVDPPAPAPAAAPAAAVAPAAPLPALLVEPAGESIPTKTIRLEGGDTATPRVVTSAAVVAPAPVERPHTPPPLMAAAPTPAPAGRTVQIHSGGTVLAAARALYGNAPIDPRTAAGLLREVRRLNPDIADPDLIAAGAYVRFPAEMPGRQLAARGSE